MKNKIIHIFKLFCIAGLFAMVSTSCEDMIEEKKFDFIQPEDIEDSDDGANQWVTGVYSKLSDDIFRWSVFPSVLEFDCDYMTGPDWSFGSFGAGNFQSSEHATTMWEKYYNLIHRANYALENIDKMQNVSEKHRKNVVGELYFLKAYAYFSLVRAYGEIPIRKASINSGIEDPNQPRQSIENVYTHVIELLTDAQNMMYKNTDAEFVEGRASAGAAASLLAKVYVTIASASKPAGEQLKVRGGTPFIMNGNDKVYTNPTTQTVTKEQVKGYEGYDSKKYFELARDKANEVITGKYGTYDLLPFDEMWTQSSKNKVEHIWSLQTISGDAKYGMTYPNAYCGTVNDAGFIINGLWWGCRDHWYKLFESKDYRIEKGVMHRWVREGSDNTADWAGGSFYPDNEEWRKKAKGYTDENGNYVSPVAPFDDGRDYRSDKNSSFLAFLTKYSYVTDNKIERTDANWPFLRFADVLLIYAEAANEANNAPTDEALAALNRVRTRSNATPKTLTGNGNIGNLVDFRSAVIEERAMELALEGDRRWDLIRWGIYLPVMNAIGGVDEVNVMKSRQSKHLLFPLPKSEMDANSAITENNPGW